MAHVVESMSGSHVRVVNSGVDSSEGDPATLKDGCSASRYDPDSSWTIDAVAKPLVWVIACNPNGTDHIGPRADEPIAVES